MPPKPFDFVTMMRMTIGEFSKRCGLSIDTLRYYEKIGLLKGIKRNKSGYRDYDDVDSQWIEFVIRLKNTDMPISGILEYADLREIGDSTLVERREILKQHSHILEKRIFEQQKALKLLLKKIEFYDTEIRKK